MTTSKREPSCCAFNRTEVPDLADFASAIHICVYIETMSNSKNFQFLPAERRRKPKMLRERQERREKREERSEEMRDKTEERGEERICNRRSRAASGRATQARRVPGACACRAAKGRRPRLRGRRSVERGGAQLRPPTGSSESPASPNSHPPSGRGRLDTAMVEHAVRGGPTSGRKHSIGRPLAAAPAAGRPRGPAAGCSAAGD